MKALEHQSDITFVVGGSLASTLRLTSAALECTPDEYLLAATEWCLRSGFNPLEAEHDFTEYEEPPEVVDTAQTVIEACDLVLREQIGLGAYVAARLDVIELAARGLLNLELQTDKRACEPVFQAIQQALIEELRRRPYPPNNPASEGTTSP
ncbi:MAG: hypothetical protein H7Y22_06100 [Gemmatimonadaceae bacterium]|nr:hypothetical protein [Gloeobacterales cyanobacterium ES-bin-141]